MRSPPARRCKSGSQRVKRPNKSADYGSGSRRSFMKRTTKRKSQGADGMRAAVKSLQRAVTETIAEEEPKGDSRGMRRQTLYLPPAVHEQLRLLAFNRRESQQEL